MTILFDETLQKLQIQINVASLIIREFKILQSTYDFSPRIDEIKSKIKKEFSIETIKEHSRVAAYRAFYWRFLGIDPTKTRPASEALIRRILADKSVPRISVFVDCYNWASIESLISLGAYDLNKIQLPVSIRFAKNDEQFTPIGSDVPRILPVNALVVVDSKNLVLCQYPYRDGQLSMVQPASKDILVLAYGVNTIQKDFLQNALELTKKNLQWFKEHGIVSYIDEPIQFDQNY